jgi:hypothetical protein
MKRGKIVTHYTYQFYQAGLLSGNNCGLAEYVEDKVFQAAKFRRLRQTEAILTDFDYAIDLATKEGAAHDVLHYSLAQSNLNTVLTKRFLYRFVIVTSTDPVLALSLVSLVSDPALRRLAFLLLALNTPKGATSLEETREALERGLAITVPVPGFHVIVTLDIVRQLAPLHPEVKSLLGLIPRSAVRTAHEEAWHNAPGLLGELGRALAITRDSAPAPAASETKQYREAQLFAKDFASGTLRRFPGPELEERVGDQFGFDLVSGVLLLIAGEFLRMGRRDFASLFLGRAIYVGHSRPRLALRTLCGLAEALGRTGDAALREEQLERIETITRVESRHGSPSIRAEDAEILAEAQAVLERIDSPSQGLGLLARRFAKLGKQQLADFSPLHRAYFAACSNRPTQAAAILEGVPQESLSALGERIAFFALAKSLGANSAAERAAMPAAEEDIDLSSLFGPAGVATRLYEMVASGEAIHVACVAFALRVSTGRQQLLDFLRIVSASRATWAKLDAALGQLVRLPGFSAERLREFSDEVLGAGQHLIVPIGMGVYFFPGVALLTVFPALMCLGAGFPFARGSIWLMLESLEVVSVGIAGAMIDLVVWARRGIWRKPELSRSVIAELGSFGAFAAFMFLFQVPRNLAEHRVSGIVASLAASFVVTVVVSMFVRRFVFAPLRRRSVVVFLLGAGFTGVMAWLGGSAASTANANVPFSGVFFAGSLWMALAVNLFIKGVVVRRRFGKKWTPVGAACEFDEECEGREDILERGNTETATRS